MALFHCPVCDLPLTDAEARQPICAVCGGSLAPPAAATATTPAPPSAVGRRRAVPWLVGAGLFAAGAVLALVAWHWSVGLAQRATEQASPTIAKTEAKGDHAPPAPAPKPAAGGERTVVAYPPLAASAKAPGDAITDGDVGARVKPVPAEPKSMPEPKVAQEQPVPAPADLVPVPPPAFQPLRGMFGGPRVAENDIDQLLKMAQAQHQDLEKLFNMAGMQELDVLGAAKMLQGFGKLQGFPGRPQIVPFSGAVPGAPAREVGEVKLTGNGITDDDLAQLRFKTNVRALDLSGTSVTDGGMEHLKGLKGLRRLNLSGTRITDRGLEALHGLTDLQELDLSKTRVTDVGSKRLQQALPNVEITR